MDKQLLMKIIASNTLEGARLRKRLEPILGPAIIKALFATKAFGGITEKAFAELEQSEQLKLITAAREEIVQGDNDQCVSDGGTSMVEFGKPM